ncbi:polysaccharide biosynthesis tyrosine autokinase [Salibacterium salarium]|uniref:non-specific protein-tyrosine kinase n=1 Tax=Salibacterium salarium TaxID=284579 RepID=A0A428N0H9_9BACI|nr:CpsD/CapB family tyrosine-protein kinase [Salibacterium salarium]RSL31920.1 polysaccharide biosynthesis tyrosine autokinase [Salibacterium salarium]
MGYRHKKRTTLSKNNTGLIAHYRPKSPLSEQYRTIRTNIQFTTHNRETNLITVTSPLPGEGKTTTAANLAVVLAQQNHKVLLIDGDMRKPICHHLFGRTNESGLTNIIIRNKVFLDVVHNTVVPNLDLLPCGPVPPNPAELLGEMEMNNLLNEVRNSYKYIILDSPPVIPVTDAQVLADKSDGIILVMRSGESTRENGIKAKELLLQARAKLLGVVLNQTKQKQDYYYEVKH